MSDEPPTQQMPPDEPPPPRQPRPPLTRSTSDSIVAGVAGGLGRHLNVDPLAIRIAFVILAFAGGFGILAYLACLVFIPSDDPSKPLRWGAARIVGAGLLVLAAIVIVTPGWFVGPWLFLLLAAGVVAYLLLRVSREEGASPAATIAARIALGVVLLALAAGGFTAAAAGSALGGGIVVAGLIIACGIGLVGGAFRGGARWLIAPAVVLALPLAAVAATDLDLRGDWGERTFRPATVAELGDGYEMGAGSMRIDLRDVELPPGRTDLPLELGLGEIQVLVPDDMCVITDGTISLGAVDTGSGEEGGVDVDLADHRIPDPGMAYLRLDVDLGIGALRVGDRFIDEGHGPPWARGDRFDEVDPGTSRAACEASP
jgi:phage shock protein PspC (stress-responsive transcriptional regulator)